VMADHKKEMRQMIVTDTSVLGAINDSISSIGVSISAIDGNIADLEDEAFGRWLIDPVAKTLTMYRVSGSVLRTFDLIEATGSISAFKERVPR
jgi:hypothetical protein